MCICVPSFSLSFKFYVMLNNRLLTTIASLDNQDLPYSSPTNLIYRLREGELHPLDSARLFSHRNIGMPPDQQRERFNREEGEYNDRSHQRSRDRPRSRERFDREEHYYESERSYGRERYDRDQGYNDRDGRNDRYGRLDDRYRRQYDDRRRSRSRDRPNRDDWDRQNRNGGDIDRRPIVYRNDRDERPRGPNGDGAEVHVVDVNHVYLSTEFVADIPALYLCPILSVIMTDPYSGQGCTWEKTAIHHWLEGENSTILN